MIVDVDTHWEVTRYPKGEHPMEQRRVRQGIASRQNGLEVADDVG